MGKILKTVTALRTGILRFFYHVDVLRFLYICLLVFGQSGGCEEVVRNSCGSFNLRKHTNVY